MAFNKIGNQVTSSIQSIFQPVSTSPSLKKDKKSDASSSENQFGQTRPVSPGDKVPFTGSQLRWLGNAVAQSNEATLNIFGGAVEERFLKVEERVTNLENKLQSDELSDLSKELADFKGEKDAFKAGKAEFRKDIAQLKEQFHVHNA